MSGPLIAAGQHGYDRRNWTPVFSDNFPGNSLNKELWNIETMAKALNRAGNEGLNAFGHLAKGSVINKRWSAWYDKYHAQTIKVLNGLSMNCMIVNERDPTRAPFTKSGIYLGGDTKDRIYHPELHRCYLGWITTQQREWFEAEKRHITKRGQAAHTFKYGAFQSVVNFSGMTAEGVRLSNWLTAAHDDDGFDVSGKMYGKDDADFDKLECDLFENEWGPNGRFRNHLMLKNLSGDRYGETPNGQVDLQTSHGINLHDGKDHVIGHLWEPDGHYWYVDGIKVQQDLERVMQVYARMEVTREANAGALHAKSPDHPNNPVHEPPYLPYDAGLYLTNVWSNIDAANKSRGVIKSINVWADNPSKRQFPGVDIDKAHEQLPPDLAPVIDNPSDRPPDLAPADSFHLVMSAKCEVGDILAWSGLGDKAKYNVYMDGRYMATVHSPEYRVEAKGSYSIEGISKLAFSKK